MEKFEPIMKCDTTENWAKAINYIPKPNEIICYSDQNNAVRLKIGDGVHKLCELDFLNRPNPLVEDSVLQF